MRTRRRQTSDASCWIAILEDDRIVFSMRRAWILLLAFILGLVALARAEPPTMPASKPEVRKDVIAAIEAQMAAFRKQDYEKAYSYAAAALRAQKPLPVFVAIVEAKYPEIWVNVRAEFGIVRDDGRSALVLVHVFAKDSDASYDYNLVKEGGRWRIVGVLRHAVVKEEKV